MKLARRPGQTKTLDARDQRSLVLRARGNDALGFKRLSRDQRDEQREHDDTNHRDESTRVKIR